jgi:hypothetical protein
MVKKNYIYTIENAILSICLFEIASMLEENINYFTVHKTIKDHFTPFSSLLCYIYHAKSSFYYSNP